jgi:hypothetical protein
MKYTFKRGEDIKYQDTLDFKKELEALGFKLEGDKEDKPQRGRPAKDKE